MARMQTRHNKALLLVKSGDEWPAGWKHASNSSSPDEFPSSSLASSSKERHASKSSSPDEFPSHPSVASSWQNCCDPDPPPSQQDVKLMLQSGLIYENEESDQNLSSISSGGKVFKWTKQLRTWQCCRRRKQIHAESAQIFVPASLDDEAFNILNYYTSSQSIASVLSTGDVVLLKGSWLVKHNRTGNSLPRRQDLPPEALWDPRILAPMLRTKDAYIVAVSYCWLSKVHPDPDGFHLRTLCPFIKPFARSRRVKVEEVAVFLDWCSLHQEPRTEEELAAFQRSLLHINLWYAHQLTEKWLLTQVPHDVQPSYEERGWPTFEREISMAISLSDSVLDLGKVNKGWSRWDELVQQCRTDRKPPMVPSLFRELASKKTFTNGADRELVSMKYQETFHDLMGSAEELWFDQLQWGEEEARSLSQVLAYCSQSSVLTHLYLHENQFADSGTILLAAALPRCEGLKEVSLDANRIGLRGATALAVAIRNCNRLEVLSLDRNDLSDKAIVLLRKAWADGCKDESGLQLDYQFSVPLLK